jgi:hypothetical protein
VLYFLCANRFRFIFQSTKLYQFLIMEERREGDKSAKRVKEEGKWVRD